MNLNELSKQVHVANIKWWQDMETGQPIKRNKGELLALIHSEISECFDGEINGDMDDKLPHRPMGEVEQADVLIRLLDYAAGFGHDLNGPALKVGVSEFENISQLKNSHTLAHIGQELLRHGSVYQHRLVSNILELERKSRFLEVPDSLIVLIFSIVVYCDIKGYDLQGAFKEKMSFNAVREDHKHEARKIVGGKQF